MGDYWVRDHTREDLPTSRPLQRPGGKGQVRIRRRIRGLIFRKDVKKRGYRCSNLLQTMENCGTIWKMTNGKTFLQTIQ